MRIIAVFSFFVICSVSLYGQKGDAVLLQIGSQKVTVNEFMAGFRQNNFSQAEATNESLRDYLDNYIKLKLKIAEAESLGMDTLSEFTNELEMYCQQLAAPYLQETEGMKKLVSQAYERSQFDIRASHILKKVGPLAPAADTLAAWNQLMNLRKRILKGEDFAKLAVRYSDDISAKNQTVNGKTVAGNGGDLGYFTAFDMVYPFENAVYNMQVGEVSMPIRTAYGYHLVKVTDKAPALGNIRLAHIMLVYPPHGSLGDSLSVTDSASAAYKLLEQGHLFADVARLYSDDHSTANNGGVLPWMRVNQLLPGFVNRVRPLQIGAYTEPFASQFGWHILMLSDKKPLQTLERSTEELEAHVARNDRADEISRAFATRVEQKYGYTFMSEALQQIVEVLNNSEGQLSALPEKVFGRDKVLFTIGQQNVLQSEFIRSLRLAKQPAAAYDANVFVWQQFKTFEQDVVKQYASLQLGNEIPKYKELLQEYHDGILLFNLMEKNVWAKAITDTAGLYNYYLSHGNDYLGESHLDGVLYIYQNGLDIKPLQKMVKKGKTDEQILKYFKQDSASTGLTIHRKIFSKGENKWVDAVVWKRGWLQPQAVDGNYSALMFVNEVLPPQPKPFNDVRGTVVNDYQTYLENQWVSQLRQKYPVTVNQELFNSLSK